MEKSMGLISINEKESARCGLCVGPVRPGLLLPLEDCPRQLRRSKKDV